MRQEVPQFIDVEDKIFGPFTFKQFLYLGGGAAASYIALKLLPLIIAIFVIPIVAGLGVSLAFVKINNRPFIVVFQASIQHFTSTRLYLWKKRSIKKEISQSQQEELEIVIPQKILSTNKLKDLTWSLDILDNQK